MKKRITFKKEVEADLGNRQYDYIVIPAAKSQYPVDFVAINSGQAMFIKCKSDGKITARERLELERLDGELISVFISSRSHRRDDKSILYMGYEPEDDDEKKLIWKEADI